MATNRKQTNAVNEISETETRDEGTLWFTRCKRYVLTDMGRYQASVSHKLG
jgi:hypothetical protein